MSIYQQPKETERRESWLDLVKNNPTRQQMGRMNEIYSKKYVNVFNTGQMS
jgi:hypothetical protein